MTGQSTAPITHIAYCNIRYDTRNETPPRKVAEVHKANVDGEDYLLDSYSPIKRVSGQHLLLPSYWRPGNSSLILAYVWGLEKDKEQMPDLIIQYFKDQFGIDLPDLGPTIWRIV